jgi:hypothetical protein
MSHSQSSTNEVVTVAMIDRAKDAFTSIIMAKGHFHVECRDALGNLEWECEAPNTLANEGANALRDFLWRLNSPALFTAGPYVGLATAAPSVSTTTSTVTEATGGGYARVAPTWTAGATGQANNTASAASWTASGTAITGASHLFITHAASGAGSSPNNKFIAYATLTGGPYTVNVGSTLNVTYTWTVA